MTKLMELELKRIIKKDTGILLKNIEIEAFDYNGIEYHIRDKGKDYFNGWTRTLITKEHRYLL